MDGAWKLAMVQLAVRGARPGENLARAIERIGAAAAAGARVALLPEALDVGWTHPTAAALAEPIPEGEACRRLSEAARRHGLYVGAGLTERRGDRVYSAAVLLAPDGRVVLHHRKLKLDNYGPVARDYRLWIAGVSNVGRLEAGPWAGRHCIGCSLLVGPDGEPVARGPYGVEAESLILADILPAPRPARGDGWPSWWHQQTPKGRSRLSEP